MSNIDWITTNIRFPADVYMDLKMEAAKRQKSLAAIIRERITKKKISKKKNIAQLMKQLDKIAERNRKLNPKLNFTQALIDMRYEQ